MLLSISRTIAPPCSSQRRRKSVPSMLSTALAASVNTGFTTGSANDMCPQRLPSSPPVTTGSKSPPGSGASVRAFRRRPSRISPALRASTSLSVNGAATSSLALRRILTPACLSRAENLSKVFFSAGHWGKRPA